MQVTANCIYMPCICRQQIHPRKTIAESSNLVIGNKVIAFNSKLG